MLSKILAILSLFAILSACAPSTDVTVTAVPATAMPTSTLLPSLLPAATPTQEAGLISASATAASPATLTPEPTATPTLESTATPSGPLALSSGQFTKIDRAHAAEGTVTLYRQPDGSLLLRLEQDFKSNPGPDLYVGLSGHPMPRSNTELNNAGYLELALLQSIEGQQDFLLSTDLDLSTYKSVVIYCKEYTVLFSTAELR